MPLHDCSNACRVETKRVASFGKAVQTQAQYISDLSLNKSNPDVRVNFLQHHKFDSESFATLKCFSWVTDLDLSEKDLNLYQRAGRARWRVENETFNTLNVRLVPYCHQVDGPRHR